MFDDIKEQVKAAAKDIAEIKAQQIQILAKLDQLLAEKKPDGPILREPGA